jgi:glycosyltransferase involved in cell wall biosynthesis
MRVAHVITRLIIGGAQENTAASVIGLRQKKHFEVELITGPTHGSEGTLRPMLEEHRVPITEIRNLVRPVHPYHDLAGFIRLARHFRRTSPSIVHTHSGKAGTLGRLAARLARVPLILHTIHGPSFGRFQGKAANLIFTQAERMAGRVTDHFVAVSDAMIDQYLAAGIGERSQYTKILSGFPLGPFQEAKNDLAWRNRYSLTASDFVVGKIARLAPLKGHPDLVLGLPELIRRCPATKVLLVGDGPLRGELEQRLQRARLVERVRFAGIVRPDEMPRHIGIMDAVVHLSYREGLPRALPQALAAARPVVAYDCDGAREVCVDGETGYLVPPGNVDLAMTRLAELGGDPALRERLGRRGQNIVCDRFSVRRMVDALDELYGTLWKRKTGLGFT